MIRTNIFEKLFKVKIMDEIWYTYTTDEVKKEYTEKYKLTKLCPTNI